PMKSPNMMSMTGRMPVIAAPTPRPEMPASEMGESMMRSGPNSSTRPESTLNGVPASATSSPMMKTVGSRRSSSASASRIAWPSVISRICVPLARSVAILGVDILRDLTLGRERRAETELDADLDLALRPLTYLGQLLRLGQPLRDEPVAQDFDRVALCLPELLFFRRAVIRAGDVADVVAVVAIGIGEQEAGAIASAGVLHHPLGRRVDRTHVLTIHLLSWQAKRRRARRHTA